MGNENESRRLRDIERIKRMRLLDDIFMKAVLKDNIEAVQVIIRILLRRDDIVVISVQTQEEISNLVGHSVRLDILAKGEDGKLYNIEIERSTEGADTKRGRYNLGAVDWHSLPPGAPYSELAETWIIFITEHDAFGRGFPVYTVNRVIEETGELFNDEEHILYVNGAYVGDDDIGRLMADFRETDPEKMHYQPLARSVRYFKNTEGGMTSMCSIAEEIRKEGREEGRVEGRREGRVEGREEGRREGICGLISVYRDELGLDSTAIIERIAARFHLTNEQAAHYVTAQA